MDNVAGAIVGILVPAAGVAVLGSAVTAMLRRWPKPRNREHQGRFPDGGDGGDAGTGGDGGSVG